MCPSGWLPRSTLGGGAIQVDAWVKAPKARQGEKPGSATTKIGDFRDL